jgi:hypothetical protein
MNPEERELLEETYALAKENNEIMRGIRRSNRWASIRKGLYWLVIIVVLIMAYNYLKPIFQQIQGTYEAIQGTAEEVQNTRTSIADFFRPNRDTE